MRVALSPDSIRVPTDGGPAIVMARLETVLTGVTNLRYEWSGGGVGPSSWGILGEIKADEDVPVASSYGGAWEGQVSFGVSVSGDFNG